jgi:endoglucanase
MSLRSLKGVILTSAVALCLFILSPLKTQAAANEVNVWWPSNWANVTGTQPFKAMLSDKQVGEYNMFWSVDNGSWNYMSNNYQDYPHKESLVDLSGWKWHSDNTYTLNFIAADFNGNKIANKEIKIVIGNPKPTLSPSPIVSVLPSPSPIVLVTPSVSVAPLVQTNSANPLAGAKLYVNPYSDPKRWADNNRSSRPAEAKLMDKIANQAEVQWFGNWNNNVYEDVKRNVETIKNSGALPVMVAYNIPARDCGGYSAGGANSPEGYKSWIKSFADGIGSNKAAVILEPDALAGMDCLSQNDQNIRVDLLKYATDTLKSKGNVSVYIDAGNPGWKTAEAMADRLKKAGVVNAQGFSLNISNFFNNSDNATYAKKISDLTGGKHYVA